MKTCHCAAKSEIDCTCGADWLCAECERLRGRVADLESDLAAKAMLIEVLLAEIACLQADLRESERAGDVP